MRALHIRLLIAIAAVLLAAWGTWFTIQYRQMLAQQGGEIDSMLRNIAEQILQSLPENITSATLQRPLTLGGETAPTAGKLSALGFQVWDRSTKRPVLSSRTAPAHAMAPDFTEGFSDAITAGEAWRVYAVSDRDQRVQVQVGLPRSAMEGEVFRWFKASLGTALLLLLFFGIAIWWVICWSLRPVEKISASLAARAPLDMTPVPDHELPSEFQPLLVSFNALMERLAVALTREREFLGEAAHELRTPLAALLAQAQVLQHAANPEQARIALDRLVSGIERASRLAQQLLDAARVEAGGARTRSAEVDLGVVVTMVADEFGLIAQRDGQTIEVDARRAPVQGDIDDLGILVRNLLDNALRHGGPGTRVKLETSIEDDGTAPYARLSVSDNGPGIPDDERERVFKRFYRAGDGPRAPGIGMGLSLVERVVASHGGTLRCGAGLDGRGFGVEIRLPPQLVYNTPRPLPLK